MPSIEDLIAWRSGNADIPPPFRRLDMGMVVQPTYAVSREDLYNLIDTIAEAKKAEAENERLRGALLSCPDVAGNYDRQAFPGFEAGVGVVKKDIAYRLEKYVHSILEKKP